jgi:PAS domain S-box-containing protein
MNDREQKVDELTRALARSTAQLRMLGEVGRAVASALDIDAVLQRIITAAVEMSGADQGTIYDYDEACSHFLPRAMHGMDQAHMDMLRATPIRLGEGAVGHAGASGQPWDVADVMAEPGYEGRMRELTVRAGLRAVLAVPMIRGEHIVGGIVVRRKAPGAFGAECISLLQIAAQSTLALQNERLLREIEAKNHELEAANRLNAQLEGRRMAEQLIEALPNPVFFKGTDGRYLGVNKAWESFFGISRESFVGKTVHELYPHHPEVAQRLHAKDQELWDRPGSQTYETVITTADGKHHDATYYKATFTGADGGVAGLIGTIIDNTASRRDEKRRAMEHAVTRVLSEAETTAEALTRVIQVICESLGWTYGANWRWDERAQVLRCRESWHTDAIELAEFVTSMSGRGDIEAPSWQVAAPTTAVHGLVRRTWVAGAPVWFRDVMRETGFRRGASAAKAGLHSAFGFPVLAGLRPLGVLEFYSDRIEAPDEALLQIVQAIGRQVGQFIQRREIEAKNREAEQRRGMEHAVTRVLSEAVTTPEALTKVIQVICESLGWAYGANWRWDERTQLLRCTETWHIDSREVAEFVTASSTRTIEAPASQSDAAKTETRGIVRRAWIDRAPMWFRDVTREPSFRRGESAAKAGLRGALGFPVLAGSQPLGVLEFYSRNAEEPDAALLQIVQAIGRQVGQFILRRESETRSSQLEAQSSNKSQFLANMSHELRTPLNAIIGYSEMLLEDAIDLEADQFVADLNKIHTSGQHLLGLINDILDLSKIEAGKMELHTEDFEIAPLIHDVVATVRPMAQKNGNQVTAECAPDLGVMRADATRVRQALLNLVSNAVKFTQQGTITISALRYVDSGNETIMLQVRDSGIGMTAEQVGRLFYDFEQADASTTRKYGGTGLGLAISRRFCRMMGGDIIVHSTLGRGSTFTIQLPGAGDAQAAREPASEPRPAPATAQRSTDDRSATVLVVDDDEAVREFMQRFLERQGYAVITAANGIDALALARDNHPAAITLDVMMPDIDGWTVLAAIKGDPALADIPVILVTIVDEKQRGYTLGATDYLVKPIDRARLAAILRSLCGRGSGSLLLVEDDDSARALIRTAVEREGWSIVEAGNGRIALDHMRNSQPDAIVLDLLMPEMDGFEFLDLLRNRPEWRGIPVIIVSALDLTPADRQRLNGKVEAIIQKRVTNSDELLRDVSQTLAACIRQKVPGSGQRAS